MRSRIMFIICVVMLAAGCATNLVREEPFAGYVGHELTLKRDARLLERKYSPMSLMHGEKRLKPGELFEIANVDAKINESWEWYDADNVHHMEQLYLREFPLPAGTPLTIKKIYSFVDGSGHQDIRAEGKVYVKSLGQYVPFVFIWGTGSVSSKKGELIEAPWEENTAQVRTVNPDGVSL